MTLIFGNDFLDMTMTAKEVSGIISDLKASAQQRKYSAERKSNSICFSLSDLFHPVWQILGSTTSLQMTPNFLPFYCWVIFHCIYVLHLYPFLCQWTFRLLLCSDYFKWWFSEYWVTCVFLNFWCIYAESRENDIDEPMSRVGIETQT